MHQFKFFVVEMNRPLYDRPSNPPDPDHLQKWSHKVVGHPLCNRPANPDDKDHLQKWSHWVILFATSRTIRMIWIICKNGHTGTSSNRLADPDDKDNLQQKKKAHTLCNWPPHMDEWIISKSYGFHILSSLQEKIRNEDVELLGRNACY